MICLKDGSRCLVFAPNGGADANPDQHHNIMAHPDIEVEMG